MFPVELKNAKIIMNIPEYIAAAIVPICYENLYCADVDNYVLNIL